MSSLSTNVNQGIVASALDLAARGFRVFPLVPSEKVPAVREFFTVASADAKRVEAMWREPVSGEPRNNNIGILCGEGFFVLDVDTKNEAGGMASLEFLVDIGLDTNTLTADTPSGGQHLFYKIPEGVYVGNSARKIGSGLDIRGWHGFVVGAGSVTDKGAYAWRLDAPMLDAPDFLIEMIRRSKPQPKGDMNALVELDTEDAISRSVFYLANEAPEGFPGSMSDTVFRVAARVIDFGISKETCFELMSDHWNDFKAHPPLEMGDLLQRIENAWSYRSKPPGVASAAADFDVVYGDDGVAADLGVHPDKKAAEARKSKLYWQRLDEAQVEATRPYLIKGLLDLGTMAVTYGESNAGKTNVVLDRALHVATGREYNGRKVMQGGVLYIAAEGGVGVRRRLRAWCMKHNIDRPSEVPFALVPCPIDMMKGDDTKRLAEIVHEVEAAFGQKVVYIIVDTLSRALAGADENSSEAMGSFVKHCDALRMAAQATVDVIHHSGKDRARGARGHSLLRAATDSEIEIEPNLVRVTKQRDMAFSDEERFKLDVVELGADQDGDKITSVVVRFIAPEFFEVELTAGEKRALKALCQMVVEAVEGKDTALGDYKFTTAEAVAYLAENLAQNGSAKDISRSWVNKILASLAEKGSAKKVERGQWVIPDGTFDTFDTI
jgi:hypothetical protein